MTAGIPLVEYLFRRLYQLGIRALHGVPGDFNLTALDHVEKCGLEWIGNANELNAGYAADGYARIKGIGAVVTTFGVGELSLTNAIGGARAEGVPVVHIVGTPSTEAQRKGLILHHTLGNGDFKVFSEVAERLTVAQADLCNPETATAEIDRVLRECWVQSQPVYIQLPTDMVDKPVDGSALDIPLDLSYSTNDKEEEAYVVGVILRRLYNAQRPVLLVDGGVRRTRLTSIVDTLVQKSKLPTFVTPMGKGLVDETYENFAGVYSGSGSFDAVRDYVENSDCILSIGGIRSDFNTTGFTYRIPTQALIDIQPDFSRINHARYDLHMRGLVPSITSQLDSSKLQTSLVRLAHTRAQTKGVQEIYSEEAITQDYLWSMLSSWLQPNDILLTETGTSYLGVWDTVLKSGMTAISQTLWCSIGYALPAAQGASIAAQEFGSKQRVILFEGDGSFQMTAQSISDMARHRLDLVIFVINNDGYTIERWVHGMEAGYNDICMWRYSDIPKAMGASGDYVRSFKVSTKEELEALWGVDEFANGKGLRFVEVAMPKKDAPMTLKRLATGAAKTNGN